VPNGNQFEVLTMGRIGVDVYPLQIGRSLLYPRDGDVAAAVDTAVGLL
jgi:hypothetical protein